MDLKRSTLPLGVVFRAVKVLSEEELINGLDDWRAGTGKDALVSFDKDLANSTLRQPPTKFGHAYHPSLWTATHFFLALPALHFALDKYGKENQATRDTRLSEAELEADFFNFLPIVEHFREYQVMAQQFGEPTATWWDSTLQAAWAKLKPHAPLREALELLPSFVRLKAERVLAHQEDSLTGQIPQAYLLGKGYTPEQLKIDKRVLHYIAPMSSHPTKSLYERLVEAQQSFSELRPYLDDYEPKHGLTVGQLLGIVTWYGRPHLVEIVTPELHGADEATIRPLLALFAKIIRDGGPDYTQPPLSLLPLQKFLDTQSLSQIGRLSLVKDVVSNDRQDISDGAVLRRLAEHIYSEADRRTAWGDVTHYVPDSTLKRAPLAVFRQDIANILFSIGLVLENQAANTLDPEPFMQLADQVKQAQTVEAMRSLIETNSPIIQTLTADWQKHFPRHERLRLLRYLQEL